MSPDGGAMRQAMFAGPGLPPEALSPNSNSPVSPDGGEMTQAMLAGPGLPPNALSPLGFLSRGRFSIIHTRRHSWPGATRLEKKWKHEHAPCHLCLRSRIELQLAVDDQFYAAFDKLNFHVWSLVEGEARVRM